MAHATVAIEKANGVAERQGREVQAAPPLWAGHDRAI